jgi:hypothetical protein
MLCKTWKDFETGFSVFSKLITNLKAKDDIKANGLEVLRSATIS